MVKTMRMLELELGGESVPCQVPAMVWAGGNSRALAASEAGFRVSGYLCDCSQHLPECRSEASSGQPVDGG